MKTETFFKRVWRNKFKATIWKKERLFTQEEVNLCNMDLKAIFN